MERKIEKESHSLGVIELDNFIKVIVYLPNDLFFKIAVMAQDYPNRFEYERREIAKFRNDIFNIKDKGVFLFSNETEYKLFLSKNRIQIDSTDYWFNVVFIEIGSTLHLINKTSAIKYIENRSNDFQNKYSKGGQIINQKKYKTYVDIGRTKFPVILKKKNSTKLILFNRIWQGTVISYGEKGREKGFEGRRWLMDEANSDYIPFDGEITLNNELLSKEDGYTRDRIFYLQEKELLVIGDLNFGIVTSLCNSENGRYKIGDILDFNKYHDKYFYSETFGVTMEFTSSEDVVCFESE